MMTLFIFLLICLSCGALGAWATAKSVKTWYPALIKPRWNPPDKVFAPVWTCLYGMMAVSAWLVWERLPAPDLVPMVLFGLQLVFNTAWSFIFFGLRRPDLALAEIIILWVLILWTGIRFFNVYWLSGALFIPYLLWVSFAVVLNGAIFVLNRSKSDCKLV